ncbi:MAG: DEAD/DEAH box helicase [Polyangiales bacterium]
MGAFARFHPRLQEAITSRVGWSSLRPVQDLAAEQILDGRNAVVLAPTAGGKTEAAFFPVLSRLLDDDVKGVGVVYVAPLKALLNNLEERVGVYAEMVGLRRFVWHGDVDDPAKQAFLKEPAEVLMTTPESLEVMLISRRIRVEELFPSLRAVIVDEVHALAGTDRGAHLLSVVERVARHAKQDVQRIGLSATVGNPADILRWLAGSSTRPGVVVDPPRAKGRKELLVIQRDAVGDLATDAATMGAGRKSLVFCQSRALTEVVADRMRARGIDVYVHHGSVSAEERAEAERRFQHGGNNAIVCTSTLELGIDVGDLDRVFQTNAPATVSSFLQRMGRTGRRAGTVPNTTFLCEDEYAVLQAVALVELAREGWVESVAVVPRCWQVLVHQLMAMALERQGVPKADAWDHLSRVPDFAGVKRAEFEALVAHLLRRNYLDDAGGLLVMGIAAEKTFGRRNFMEMYAVFSTPVLFHVKTQQGADLGTVEQDFVDRLVPKISAFLLAGRPWLVEAVQWKDKVVLVSAAPEGVKPTWGAKLPQLLGNRLCRRMRQALLEDVEPSYLHATALAVLRELRRDLRPRLERPEPAIAYESQMASWWTWAGGRINHTLKHAIELKTGWRVVADNFHLRLEGDVSADVLNPLIDAMRERAFWDDPAFAAALLAKLPDYRLSKFQPAMPEAAAREMVAGYLLDVPGTVAFLQPSAAGAAPPAA